MKSSQDLLNITKKAVEKKGQERIFKRNTTSKETKILIVLTNNQSLPNISNIVAKHLHILSINKSFKEFST